MGFDELEDTWEPVARMIRDIPLLCLDYIEKNIEKAIVKRLKKAYRGQLDKAAGKNLH